MFNKYLLRSCLLFGIIFFSAASSVRAIDVPSFPSCQSPTGTLKVSYDSGIHGIVGDSGQYIGSDRVYTVSDSNLIQCFCSVSGSGIQTNWWKQDSLTGDQINILKNLGWIYIPSGSLWGLDDAVYFAKNSTYNCGSTGGGGGGTSEAFAPACDSAKPAAPTLISVVRTGSSAVLTWTPVSTATHYTIAYGLLPNTYIYGVPNTGNVTTFTVNALDPDTVYFFAVKAVNNCMPSDFSGTQNIGGGQVLGLATTGTASALAISLIAGSIFLGMAFLLKRKINRAA